MAIDWYLADLVEGFVLAEFPLAGGDSLQRAMSAEGSGSWTFGPTDPRTPKNWAGLIQPGAVMVVAVLDGNPIQAWPITTAVRSDAAPQIAGPTLEGLLSRVFVRDYEAYGLDEAFICAAVAEQVFAPGFNFTTTAFGSGTTRDVYYDGVSDMTVRALFDEFAEADPPIEFACDVRWAAGQEGSRFAKRLRVGAGIGTVVPSVIFDDSCIVSHTTTTSFAEGFGATRTWAVSDGSGDTRPMVGPFETQNAGRWGPWESRAAFATVNDEAGLAARGRQVAADRANGTEVREIVLDLARAPKVGLDWDIGDTVTFSITPSATDPVGGTFAGRVMGFELNTASNTITPTLKQEAGDTA